MGARGPSTTRCSVLPQLGAEGFEGLLGTAGKTDIHRSPVSTGCVFRLSMQEVLASVRLSAGHGDSKQATRTEWAKRSFTARTCRVPAAQPPCAEDFTSTRHSCELNRFAWLSDMSSQQSFRSSRQSSEFLVRTVAQATVTRGTQGGGLSNKSSHAAQLRETTNIISRCCANVS